MPIIQPYGGRAPRLHPSVYVAPDGVVVGDVEVGEGASIWFGTVVRGDVNHVRIGARTNLQERAGWRVKKAPECLGKQHRLPQVPRPIRR